MTVNNMILALIFLILLPILMGNTVLGCLKKSITISNSLLFGYITMWAVCQVVSVPLIIFKQSFLTCVYILSACYIVIVGFGIVKQYFPKITITFPKNIDEWFGMLFLYGSMAVMVLSSLLLQHTDADDSRFVVNAVDTLRTNRMLLTDVNTGHALTSFVGDLYKDVASPWPIFMAYLSKLTRVQPAIMMHTCMAPILTLLACLTYKLLAEKFFSEDRLHQGIFVFFVVMLSIFGYYTTHTIGTVTMLRIWQGKATIAAVGIPLLLYVLISLFEEYSKNEFYILFLVNIALCLPSNMGILIAGFMIGVFGLTYAIVKKNVKYFINTILICFINLVYIGISYGIAKM